MELILSILSLLYLLTLSHSSSLPGRANAPQIIVVTSNEITIQINYPQNLKLTQIDSQYRVYSDTTYIAWLDGLSISLSRNILYPPTINFTNLTSDTTYEIRIRYNNEYGNGPYSSSIFTTAHIISDFPSSIDFKHISTTYIDIEMQIKIQPNQLLSYNKQYYQLQYKLPISNNYTWINYPQVFSFTSHIQGVAIQEFNLRVTNYDQSDSDHKQIQCTGSFWLQLSFPTVNNPKLYISQPLSYDASADAFASALKSIPIIKRYIESNELLINVYRTYNAFNGYTWRIETSGSALSSDPSVFPLRVYKQTLTSQLPVYTNGSILAFTQVPCYSPDPSRPIVSKIISSGADTYLNDTQTVRLAQLEPDSTYYFRVQLVNQQTSPYSYLYSDIYSASTLQLPSSAFIADPSTQWATGPRDSSTLSSPNTPRILQSITISGLDYSPANQQDFLYSPGVVLGGLSGEGGGPGQCAVILQASTNSPNSVFVNPSTLGAAVFSYIGHATQTFTIQSYLASSHILSNSAFYFATVKCWGGGGGGGKLTTLNKAYNATELSDLSPGGGGGFAQTTIQLQMEDQLIFSIGEGGHAAAGETGGLGGYPGGGKGCV